MAIVLMYICLKKSNIVQQSRVSTLTLAHLVTRVYMKHDFIKIAKYKVDGLRCPLFLMEVQGH